MPSMDTGSAAASGDAGEPDFQAKYNGLMRAFNKRTEEAATSAKALATAADRQAELEAELAAYRARDEEANADERDRATYESLRSRFEPGLPTPGRLSGDPAINRLNPGPREDKPDTSVAWPV